MNHSMPPNDPETVVGLAILAVLIVAMLGATLYQLGGSL